MDFGEKTLILSGMRPDHKDTRRLYSETFNAIVGKVEADEFNTEAHPGFKVIISVARLKDGQVHEVVFHWKGNRQEKLGLVLHDLGIATSRAIQARNPITGETL